MSKAHSRLHVKLACRNLLSTVYPIAAAVPFPISCTRRGVHQTRTRSVGQTQSLGCNEQDGRLLMTGTFLRLVMNRRNWIWYVGRGLREVPERRYCRTGWSVFSTIQLNWCQLCLQGLHRQFWRRLIRVTAYFRISSLEQERLVGSISQSNMIDETKANEADATGKLDYRHVLRVPNGEKRPPRLDKHG